MGELGERERVWEGTVTPPDVGFVLGRVVLRVVDPDVDTGGPVVARCPLGGAGEFACAKRALVVGEIRDRAAAVVQAVADGRTGMARQRGRDLHIRELERPEP